MRKWGKRATAVGALLLVVCAVWWFLIQRSAKQVPLSVVMADVREGRVGRIVDEADGTARAYYRDDGGAAPAKFFKYPGTDLYQALLQSGPAPENMPEVVVEHPGVFRRFIGSIFFQTFCALLFSVGSVVLLLAHYINIRTADTTTQDSTPQGQDPALQGMRELAGAGWKWIEPRYQMSSVAGLEDDVRRQVEEVVEMFRDEARFSKLGARPPRGVLLIGPSGVGKTMLAHAIAQELKFEKLCYVVGPSLLGPFVGLSSMRLSKLFEEARRRAPSVILFDEFEVVGASRHNTRISGIDTESHNLVVHLMMELDALKDERVLVIAATNRGDMLDPALLRSGRFERQIYIDLPTAQGRKEILEAHSRNRKLKLAGDMKLSHIAGASANGAGPRVTTSGFSGADLVEVLNEAAIGAGIQRRGSIEMEHVEVAVKRVRRLMLRRSANENEGGIGRSLAQFYEGDQSATTFVHVGGQTRAKTELRMIIDFLRDTETYVRAGCRVPKGVLLSGPPGVGKTLMARAVAGEAGVPFFYASGSEFVEVYVGVAAARVRDLFRIAGRQRPCIVFIDEIDALASHRGGRDEGGGEEYNHALNQFLAALDGFERNDGVVVIGATNRADSLDAAMLRPGRMDYVVEMTLPDADARREIIAIYLKTAHRLSSDELSRLVALTEHKSGAEIENLINTARINAVKMRRESELEWTDIKFALEQVRRGESAVLLHP